jgi:regulator of sigma E protease
MRVVRFSIGFGPTLWKHKPKDSPTVYQVALIPFLAYVQIAGMNPYEESDPKDPGSYANAGLWARIVTIAAGPLTNYFFASVLIFLRPAHRRARGPGRDEHACHRSRPGPAQTAGVETNDKIEAVNGTPVGDVGRATQHHPLARRRPRRPDRRARRGDAAQTVTPGAKGDKDEGLIRVRMPTHVEPVGLVESAKISVIAPPVFVYENVLAIGRVLAGKDKLTVSGPVGIVKETAKQARTGPGCSSSSWGC